MKVLISLFSLLLALPFSAQAESWGDLGEPTKLNGEQAFSAFIQGACQHLKASTSKAGDTWYIKTNDDGPAKLMAQNLNDAVFIKVCNAVWSGEKAPLDAVSYAGPFQSDSVATTDDLLTKYGKRFATFALAGYIDSLERINCSSPPSLPEKNDDALRSDECGKSLDEHDQIVSSLLPDCENGSLDKEACALIHSVKENAETLRKKRDVLLSLESAN